MQDVLYRTLTVQQQKDVGTPRNASIRSKSEMFQSGLALRLGQSNNAIHGLAP
ncbi:MAG: hypothetical protein KGQ51_11795 [Planctomycetes bacterium]|nr:hypothetical protein [Planctomycetota bacterium]